MNKSKIKTSCLLFASLFVLSGCGNNTNSTSSSSTDITSDVTKEVTGISIDKTAIELEVDGRDKITATIEPNDATDKALIWSSSNESLVTVDSFGNVHGIGIGQATITVKSRSNPEIFKTCTVTVKEKTVFRYVESIELSTTKIELEIGGNPATLNYEVLPNNATNKTISTRTEALEGTGEIFSYSNGVVRPLSVGKANLIFVANDGSEVTATCEITVVDNNVYVESVSLNKTELNLKMDEKVTETLVATVYPSNATNKNVTWTSSNVEVATVDNNGTVVALKDGDTVISVRTVDGEKEATCNVHVEPATREEDIHIESFSLNQSNMNLELALGKSIDQYLIATINPSNSYNKKINFTTNSNKISIEEINDTTARISAVEYTNEDEEIVITATADDTTNEVEAQTCVVKVVDPIVHVERIELVDVVDNHFELEIGNAEQLSSHVRVYPENATSTQVKYTSNDPAAVYIDEDNIIHGVKECSNIIVTASSAQDTEVSTTFTVSIKDPNKATRIVFDDGAESYSLKSNSTLNLGERVRVVNYKDQATQNQAISWSVINGSEYASVNNTGVVTPISNESEGDVTIRASWIDGEIVSDEIYKDIVVHVIPEITVNNLVAPTSINSYETKSNANNQTSTENVYLQDGSADGFRNKYFESKDEEERIYKVGNLGGFYFAPTASLSTGIETSISLTNSLEVKDTIDGSYSEATISEYATVSTSNEFNFLESAIGKYFRLTVKPDTNLYNFDDRSIMTFEFKVINGYNVNNFADFTLADNVNSWWDNYHPISENVSSIIMHKDISLTNNLLPDGFKWTLSEVNSYLNTSAGQADFSSWCSAIGYSEEEGRNAFIDSPKDVEEHAIFAHKTKNEDFTIEGNFFELTATDCKQIVFLGSSQDTLVGGLKGDGSHTQIFGINLDIKNNEETKYGGSYTMNNFSITGNGANANSNKYKGAFILIKSNGTTLNMNNTITKNSFSTILTKEESTAISGTSVLNLNRNKSYDSYNSALYVWGTKNNNITDSWLTSAGGPLILMDEPFNGSSHNTRKDTNGNPQEMIPETTVNNSYLFNPITGSEPWFAGHEGSGTLVQSYLVASGDYTNDAGWIGKYAYGLANSDYHFDARTITDISDTSHKCVNFIAIDVCAAHFADNVYDQLHGKFTVTNGTTEADLTLDRVQKIDYGGHKITSLAPAVSPIIIQGSNSNHGVGYIDAGDNNTPKWVGNDNGYSALVGSDYISYYMDPVLSQQSESGYFIGALLGTYRIQ